MHAAGGSGVEFHSALGEPFAPWLLGYPQVDVISNQQWRFVEILIPEFEIGSGFAHASPIILRAPCQ